ncbi:heat shock protein 30-like [Aplochiton taeniatus]
MLCSLGFKSSFPVCSIMDVYWPVLGLWSEIQPLLSQQELLLKYMEELNSKLEEMDKLQHQFVKETDHSVITEAIQRVSHNLEEEGEPFALTLDTKDFSPEELSVKQVGRKLRVSGKTKKKQEDGKGSYSFIYQEFRKDIELPVGVNPEVVTCLLDQDGKLHIQAAAKTPSYEESERIMPINRSQDEKTPQSLSSQDEDSNKHSPSP